MFVRSSARRAAVTRTALIPAPAKGWVQSGNISRAGLDQAEVLDNFFPTAQGASLRGGSAVYANIGVSVKELLVYSTAVTDMFAATDTGLYDCDRINGGGAVFADLTGLGSAAWSTVQISTSGGQFLWMVNGTDHAHYWNGTTFYPITTANPNDLGYDALTTMFLVGQTVTGGTSGATATVLAITQLSATTGTLKLGTITGTFQNNEAITSASGAATVNGTASAGPTITITGVATGDLTQAWLFKSRIFAIEKNSQSAWYLPVESLGGAATEFPLGSVFNRGGNLMLGATWSVDSGSGLDDMCVFVTENGEIAVYQGTDPSSPSTFALVGVYDIAKPISKTGTFKAGGDLAILTEDGIISITEALRKDRAALSGSAITYPIEDAWKTAVTNRTSVAPITTTLWQSQAMLLVGVPNSAFVANARTGAWARYTGWDVRCSAVAGDFLFFGTSAGKVMKAESGGSDDGIAYTGVYVPKFSEFSQAAIKTANHASATIRAVEDAEFTLFGLGDYRVDLPSAPVALGQVSGDVWGTGVWGTFVWGSSADSAPQTVWKAVAAQGYSLSLGMMVTSNQTTKPEFDILAMHLRYEIGNAL